jgi:hypothetical protein
MSSSNKQDAPVQATLPQPLSVWWSGFDYVFGYQLKMVQHFWGLSDKR